MNNLLRYSDATGSAAAADHDGVRFGGVFGWGRRESPGATGAGMPGGLPGVVRSGRVPSQPSARETAGAL